MKTFNAKCPHCGEDIVIELKAYSSDRGIKHSAIVARDWTGPRTIEPAKTDPDRPVAR